MRSTYLQLALLVCISSVWSTTSYAQQTGPGSSVNGAALPHTAATLRAEMLSVEDAYPERDPSVAAARERSVPLAFGLSAVVPGVGQAYNRQWIKAGVAMAVEVALVAGYTTWRQRGYDGRDDYQVYAHEYWSPLRYAYWLNDYKNWLEVSAQPITITPALESIDFSNPDAWTSAERSTVRALFDQIRTLETQVYHPETGASFSHKLPYFGEQQYYELVGKYFQFAPGWSDYQFLEIDGRPTWVDAEGNFIASIDPEQTGSGGSKVNVSDRFYQYAEDHAQANTYLRRASRMSVFFLANHFLAAVDAAVFAKLHNNRVQTELTMQYNALGMPEPGLTITVDF